jgi:hypothetical protein
MSEAHVAGSPVVRVRAMLFFFLGYLRTGLACLRQSNRDRLLAALDGLAGPTAFQLATLHFVHRALDFTSTTFLFSSHFAFPYLKSTRLRSFIERRYPSGPLPFVRFFRYARRICTLSLKRLQFLQEKGGNADRPFATRVAHLAQRCQVDASRRIAPPGRLAKAPRGSYLIFVCD